MERYKPKHYGQTGPEAKVQTAFCKMMSDKGWFTKVAHGGAYQSGWPDVFCSHPSFKIRWVEIKLPGMRGSKFTPAQLEVFPQMIKFGSPIWIITAATESEYQKLFGKSNFLEYINIVLARGDRFI